MPKYLNSFRSPTYIEQDILNEHGDKVGAIRIKPSSVLWKPKSAHDFYAVPLSRFTEWIMSDEANAKRTSS